MAAMLVICDQDKEIARRMTEFASRRENWYVPGVSEIPGSRPEQHYVFAASTSVVFSWTYDTNKQDVYKHISMRGRREGTVPNSTTAFTIATWFGFTGATVMQDIAMKPGPDWLLGPNPSESTLVIVQKVTEDEMREALSRSTAPHGP